MPRPEKMLLYNNAVCYNKGGENTAYVLRQQPDIGGKTVFLEKNRKKVRLAYFLCAVLAGVLLGRTLARPDISGAFAAAAVVLTAAALLIAALLINQLWYRAFLKQVDSLKGILTEQNDPDRYIEEIGKLRKGKKSAQTIALLQMMLAEAYRQKQDLGKAKECLAQTQPQKLHGLVRAGYLLQWMETLLALEETEPAMRCLEQNRAELMKLEKSDLFGPSIALLRVWEQTEQGEAEAAALLAEAKQRWSGNLQAAPRLEIAQALIDAKAEGRDGK